MKKIHYLILLLAVILAGCTNGALKKEVDSLKNDLNSQADLIKQIQKGLTVKSVDKSGNGYTITFSNNNTISLQDGQSSVITIGTNGNWFIDGVDTGKASEGANGSSPNIIIGANGNWFINGVDTGKPSKGTTGANGKDAPVIIAIIKTQDSFIFNFSDGSSIRANMEQKLAIVGWGDSLTAGSGGNGTTYLSVLQSLLGSSYNTVNCGVGGEAAATIAARQGGVTAYLSKGFTLPKSTDWLVISQNITMGNTFTNKYGESIVPLQRDNDISVNPCYIQNVECTLNYDAVNKNWRIHRNVVSDHETIIPVNSPVFFYGSKAYRSAYAQVFWLGHNDSADYLLNGQLIAYYQQMISFSGSPNFLTIGLHTGTAATRAKFEKSMSDTFGQRFINWREYISSMQAFYDAGLTPTQADLDAIAEGSLPPSFWSSPDDMIHLNAKGYTLLGKLIYKRFQILGIQGL
jgi:lysophospholipase L1-like esterase